MLIKIFYIYTLEYLQFERKSLCALLYGKATNSINCYKFVVVNNDLWYRRNIARAIIFDGHEKHIDLNCCTTASLAGNLFAGCSVCSCHTIFEGLRGANRRLAKPHEF